MPVASARPDIVRSRWKATCGSYKWKMRKNHSGPSSRNGVSASFDRRKPIGSASAPSIQIQTAQEIRTAMITHTRSPASSNAWRSDMVRPERGIEDVVAMGETDYALGCRRKNSMISSRVFASEISGCHPVTRRIFSISGMRWRISSNPPS